MLHLHRGDINQVASGTRFEVEVLNEEGAMIRQPGQDRDLGRWNENMAAREPDLVR